MIILRKESTSAILINSGEAIAHHTAIILMEEQGI